MKLAHPTIDYYTLRVPTAIGKAERGMGKVD